MENSKILDARQLVLVADQVTSYEQVSVSPAVALNWLDTTEKNRDISRSMVRRYSNDMRGGLWTYAADPIRFDVNGHLIDGQHRLEALAKLPRNTRIVFMVVTGLPPESQMVMDQGRKRTAGQQLKLTGVKNSSVLASGVRIVLMWDQELLFASSHLTVQITTPMIAEWVENNPDLVEFLNIHLTKIKSTDAPPAAAVAFSLAAARRDIEVAELFFTTLHEMTNLPPGSPILALSKRLTRIRREGFAVPTRDYLALFIQTWNAWIDGESVQKFQRPKGGEWTPETFPEMK